MRGLLGGEVEAFEAEKRLLPVRFDAPEDFRDFFKRTYGPVIATYRRIADEPDEVAALNTALAGLARDAMDAQGRMDWEYLLVTARRTP